MLRALRLVCIASMIGLFNLALLIVVVGLTTVKAGPTASQNGDVNGDGSVNLADAVYLLAHIFEGGPAPVAVAGGPVPYVSVGILGIANPQSAPGLPGLNPSYTHDWNLEYDDPYDLHAPGASEFQLGAGTWQVGYRLLQAFNPASSYVIVVNGTMHSFSYDVENYSHAESTIVRLDAPGTVELRTSQIILNGGSVPGAAGVGCEFWAVRISD